MIVTEREAAEKGCYRTLEAGTWAPERGGFDWPEPRFCIGSVCMAWRWFDAVSDDGIGCFATPTKLAPRVPQNDPHIPLPLEQRRGYCGAAGKP